MKSLTRILPAAGFLICLAFGSASASVAPPGGSPLFSSRLDRATQELRGAVVPGIVQRSTTPGAAAVGNGPAVSAKTTSGVTCNGAATCNGKATCNGQDTCDGKNTCNGTSTCDGTITCNGATTCNGKKTCAGKPTCNGSATCNGTRTCTGAPPCPVETDPADPASPVGLASVGGTSGTDLLGSLLMAGLLAGLGFSTVLRRPSMA